jgi:hypothetical protein
MLKRIEDYITAKEEAEATLEETLERFCGRFLKYGASKCEYRTPGHLYVWGENHRYCGDVDYEGMDFPLFILNKAIELDSVEFVQDWYNEKKAAEKLAAEQAESKKAAATLKAQRTLYETLKKQFEGGL